MKGLQAARIALVMLACLATPVAARQSHWYELYDQAVAHIGRGELNEAEQKLLAAKKTGPKPGRDVLTYGTRRLDFFPDYYLGVVYLKRERYREALSEFELARDQKP